ncbi:MAG: helix-turn-helix transcriptional regulator [Lentihominibacter sp.]
MVSEVFFFTYIFAGFVGLLVILMVLLLTKYRTDGNRKLLSAIRNFMICTALIDALYFYLDYRVLVTGHHTAAPILRVTDICLFIGQVYFWSAYLREKGNLKFPHNKTAAAIFYGLFGLSIASAVLCYGFLMNDYYLTPDGTERTASVILEMYLCVFLTFVNLWHLYKSLGELVQKKLRVLITLISVFIAVNGTWNAILVTQIMTGYANPENGTIVDPTALFIFIINLLTIILVLQEDFSALFTIPDEQPEQAPSIDSRLDFIAQTHNLTHREREVMELAYEGLTNPEIAEELVISKYTVKHHMHNIFEKLDISTRMELVHLVNQENSPGGLL